MELVMFSIYDSKAEAYVQPFFASNTKVAIRMFESAVHDEGSDFHRHAEDYTMFRIGVFSQATGDFEHENVVAIVKAIELRSAAE